MHALTDLLTHYPILTSLSSYISTLDLYHLASANRACRSHIQPSQARFDVLKRSALCDGRGLAMRHSFSGPYRLPESSMRWGVGRENTRDTPIEVRLWNKTCDEAGALPCIKCNINICEECRYYPRERPEDFVRRPHLNSCFQAANIFCLCPPCDSRLEQELQGQHLNELCDCDVYKRWICLKCHQQELKESHEYFKDHTEWEYEGVLDWDDPGQTKIIEDHNRDLQFWCVCGANVPHESRPRCSWCKRRHLPEDDWWDECDGKMPFFDEDPCYPVYKDTQVGGGPRTCVKPYPKLAYDGPIWEVVTREMMERLRVLQRR